MASLIHRGMAIVCIFLSINRLTTAYGEVLPVTFSMEVIATGLTQPDGLAVHPLTGEVYVSEETKGRISVLRGGRAVPVIHGSFPVRSESDPAARNSTTLNSPEGITFSPEGDLYAVEDVGQGRVLRFSPDGRGGYGQALSITVPDLGEPYAWESVAFAPDGRLFLAGSSYEASTGWGYSSVIHRDADQTWWMMDHGPLASFSAVAMAQEEPVVIVGDESVGSLTWWDIDLRRELQTQTHSLGGIEGLCALPDGTVVVAVERAEKGGRLLRVDPAGGQVTIIAEQLGSLESVIYDRKSGRLLVTEDSSGRVLAFRPSKPIEPSHTLMKIARRSSEAQRGIPPRQTPDFLRKFMRNVGVELVDHQEDSRVGRPGKKPVMTLEELGRRIPMVAGRVQVEAMPGVDDPVTEISFLSLFPNQISQIGGQTIPSLCLYAAKRRSGQVDHSQTLKGIKGGAFNRETGWKTMAENSFLMLPLATCSTVQNSNGVTVVLTFLGLDRMEDSFLTLNYGRVNEAYFATSGDQLRVAKATFTERQSDGEEVHNFAMTGVRPRRMEEATWMRLNPQANWTLLTPGVDAWISRRTMAVMPELVAKMRRYNHYIVDTLLAESPVVDEPSDVVDEKDTSPDTAPTVPQRAHKKPTGPFIPLADLQLDRHDEADEGLTNMILSKIVTAWNSGWGR